MSDCDCAVVNLVPVEYGLEIVWRCKICNKEYGYDEHQDKQIEKLTAENKKLIELAEFYADYENFNKHPDEEFIEEVYSFTKYAQLGHKARKVLAELKE